MKMKFTATSELALNWKAYPGAKTSEEALEREREWIERGCTSVSDVLGEDCELKVELVE